MQFFTSHSRSVQSSVKNDISKGRLELEQHVPKSIYKVKVIIKDDICMKFYNEKEPLYLGTDVSGVGLGAGLPQARDGLQSPQDEMLDNTVLWPEAFKRKNLTCAETKYRNIERETLGILHGLEKFHHHCLACVVSMTTDCKLLVVYFKKEVATLLSRLQQILLCIHQYRIKILYKPGPQFYIVD